MFFDNFERFKFDWEKIKSEWDSWDLGELLYQKIQLERRIKIETFLIENIKSQVYRFLNAQKKEFICDDQTQISFLEINPEGKETLLFLHGFGDIKENFYKVAISLTKQYRILLPDLPGMGESSNNINLNYSLESYANWFEQFITDHQNGPIHLMGNSLGGAIALKLTLENPKLFTSLTLLNCAGVSPHHHPSLYDELSKGEIIFAIESLEQFNSFLNRLCVRLPYTPTPLKFWMYRLFTENRELFVKITKDLTYNNVGTESSKEKLAELYLNKDVHNIEIPTLILWGERDTLFPVEVAAFLHTQIKNSQLVLLEEVGHIPQIEAPKRVVKRYNEFQHNFVRNIITT